MSTDLKTKMNNKLVTRFWGGINRGVCLQVACADTHDVLQFTKKDLRAFREEIDAFLDGREEEKCC